jgi:carboxyl-terminal processing protease
MLIPSATRRLLIAAAATASILLVGAYHFATGETGMSGADDLSEFDGVWRSRGYGWVWAIEDGRLRTYEASGAYCIKSGKARDLGDVADGLRLSEDGRTFRIALDDPTYDFAFDRIDSLPAACTAKPDASPAGVLRAIEEIFSAHYAFFRERKIAWPAIMRAAKARVTTGTSDAELVEIIGELFARFPDDHVSLKARADGEKIVLNTGEGKTLKSLADQAREEGTRFNDLVEGWKKSVWTKETEQRLLGHSAHSGGNGNIKYGLIDRDIGFLAILSMDDFAEDDGDAAALDEALDRALALFEGAKAVIVDVSMNDGGQDALARQIAARFARKRTLAYSKHAGDAPGSVPQAIYLQPSTKPRYTGPVYLLTSDVTVSAAEIFAMAMRALPNVTHVGQPTRGSLSDMLTKPLPNGWAVTLSNEVYLDADGKAWEGRGIPPKIPVPVFRGGDHAAAYVQAVRAVADCARGKGCAGS